MHYVDLLASSSHDLLCCWPVCHVERMPPERGDTALPFLNQQGSECLHFFAYFDCKSATRGWKQGTVCMIALPCKIKTDLDQGDGWFAVVPCI